MVNLTKCCDDAGEPESYIVESSLGDRMLFLSRPPRALTVHNPWASALAFEIKTFENRTWRHPYRGLLAIHSAQRPRATGWKSRERHAQAPWPLIPDRLAFGSILAIARLASILSLEDLEVMPPLQRASLLAGQPQPWGPYLWKITDVLAVEPIPATGRQGLWTWRPPSEGLRVLRPDEVQNHFLVD